MYRLNMSLQLIAAPKPLGTYMTHKRFLIAVCHYVLGQRALRGKLGRAEMAQAVLDT